MKFTIFSKIFVSAALLFCTAQLMAKKVDMGYMVGEIVAAEFTAANVEILGRELSLYPNNFASPRYVIVTMRLQPSRSVNPVDYTLNINNQTAPCLAVAENDGSFVCGVDTLSSADFKQCYRMVFVFDGKKLPGPGNGKTMRANFKSNVSGRSSLTFNVTDIGSQNYTPAKNIPAGGLLK